MNNSNELPNHQLFRREEIGIIRMNGYIKRRIGFAFFLVLISIYLLNINVLLSLLTLCCVVFCLYSLFIIFSDQTLLNYHLQELIFIIFNIVFLSIVIISHLIFRYSNVPDDQLFYLGLPYLIAIPLIYFHFKSYKKIKNLMDQEIQ